MFHLWCKYSERNYLVLAQQGKYAGRSPRPYPPSVLQKCFPLFPPSDYRKSTFSFLIVFGLSHLLSQIVIKQGRFHMTHTYESQGMLDFTLWRHLTHSSHMATHLRVIVILWLVESFMTHDCDIIRCNDFHTWLTLWVMGFTHVTHLSTWLGLWVWIGEKECCATTHMSHRWISRYDSLWVLEVYVAWGDKSPGLGLWEDAYIRGLVQTQR